MSKRRCAASSPPSARWTRNSCTSPCRPMTSWPRWPRSSLTARPRAARKTKDRPRPASPCGADGADGDAGLVDAVDTDEGAGVRSVYHHPVADVDPDVVDGRGVRVVGGVEQQVAALQVAQGNLRAGLPLVAGPVRELDPRARPRVHGQA